MLTKLDVGPSEEEFDPEDFLGMWSPWSKVGGFLVDETLNLN